MSLSRRILICLGAIVVIGTTAHAEGDRRDRHQIEEATRLQVFLDNSNFGPGKIDGRDGEFTRKAVALFKRSQGQADAVAQDSKAPIDTTGLDLAGVDPVFATYVVTKEDVENAGKLPDEVAAQAEMKWLPYRSVAEAVAEKFHCDVDFLKELNPTITEELKEGERGSTFHILPPGPNNPAGVIWIELNKKGIGIHGASDPDLIGRDASHGCIRLANWDVAKVAGMVKAGVPVVVE
ncbi:MAG: L,D-transpeptidase family protein [Terrimicrobiaceae bacterium]